jgi:hypothetical protein
MHAHYIDSATARRARTRRVVGAIAPDPALRVMKDDAAGAATAADAAQRKRTRRAADKASSPPALRAVRGGADATEAGADTVQQAESRQ